MKFRPKTWLILAVILAVLCGCASTPDRVDPVAKVIHLGPDTNRTAQVDAGNMMLQTQKGDHFTAYQLYNTVRSSFLGNSCTLTPQTFVKISQDEEFYYGISGRDYVKPSPLNWQNKDYLRTCLCGIRFSQKDLNVVAVILEHRNGSIDKVGPSNIDGSTSAVLKPVPMINLYAANFLRKTLKFDSFADGFLILRYMEERGKPNGYDAQGNPVAVPPDVTERMYEFDLQAAKTIDVQGAKIEILDAKPDKLTYKIIRQMSVE
ncbi:MAG: hypothetical protein Q7I89_08040 [Syntrophales bacterium]|nr:hypothetical protein [Syntrophales bacterium]